MHLRFFFTVYSFSCYFSLSFCVCISLSLSVCVCSFDVHVTILVLVLLEIFCSEWPLTFISWTFRTNMQSMYDVRDKNVGVRFVRPCYFFFYFRWVCVPYSLFVNVYIFMYHSCTLPWLTSLPFLFNFFSLSLSLSHSVVFCVCVCECALLFSCIREKKISSFFSSTFWFVTISAI